MKRVLPSFILTIIFAAVGWWLRGYLLKTAYDASGLPVAGSAANTALIVLCVVFLCLLAAFVFTIRYGRRELDPEALTRTGFTGLACGVVSGAALFVFGVMSLLLRGTRLDMLLGILALAAGVCKVAAALMVQGKKLTKTTGLMFFEVIFTAFWLVCAFREYGGNDPVLQNYAYIILAVVCCLLGVYFYAGFAYKAPKPLLFVYFALAAAFFCAVSLADQTAIAGFCLFGSYLLSLLSSACVVLRNMGRMEQLNEE